MNYLDGVKLVNEGGVLPIILISGEEKYLKEDLLNRIENKYTDPLYKDMNIDKLPNNVEFKEFHEICETLPFLADKRLVIVKDFPMDKNGISKISNFLDPLFDYLNEFPSTTILVIMTQGKAFKGKFLKNAVQWLNHFEVNKLNYRELSGFIRKSLSEKKLSNEKNIIDFIIDNSMYLDAEMNLSLYDVENELEKIKNLDKAILTIQDIEEVMIQSIESNIFRLTDAIGEKNREKALHIYFRLLKSDMDPFRIFYMIIRQIRNLFYIKWGEENHCTRKEIRESIGISDYEFKKVSQYTKNWSFELLKTSMRLSYETEIKLKTSQIPQDELFRSHIINILS